MTPYLCWSTIMESYFFQIIFSWVGHLECVRIVWSTFKKKVKRGQVCEQVRWMFEEWPQHLSVHTKKATSGRVIYLELCLLQAAQGAPSHLFTLFKWLSNWSLVYIKEKLDITSETHDWNLCLNCMLYLCYPSTRLAWYLGCWLFLTHIAVMLIVNRHMNTILLLTLSFFVLIILKL